LINLILVTLTLQTNIDNVWKNYCDEHIKRNNTGCVRYSKDDKARAVGKQSKTNFAFMIVAASVG